MTMPLMLVTVSDFQHVRIECSRCNAAVVRPLGGEKRPTVPRECAHCGEAFAAPEGNVTVASLQGLVDSICEWQKVAARAPFKVCLELGPLMAHGAPPAPPKS